MARLDELVAAGEAFANMDTGGRFRTCATGSPARTSTSARSRSPKRSTAAPQIVITGRGTDPGLVLGPMIHEFGWAPDD